MHDKTVVRRPWYKEPWPWLLMTGPLIVVVAGLSTFKIAVDTDDGLVTDDYYKEGQEINRKLARDDAARAMGIRAQLMFSEDKKSVRIVTQSQVQLPATLSLRFAHPVQDDYDQTISVKETSPGVYEGALTPLQPSSHWYVNLEDASGQWRIQSEWLTDSNASMLMMQPRPKLKPADD